MIDMLHEMNSFTSLSDSAVSGACFLYFESASYAVIQSETSSLFLQYDRRWRLTFLHLASSTLCETPQRRQTNWNAWSAIWVRVKNQRYEGTVRIDESSSVTWAFGNSLRSLAAVNWDRMIDMLSEEIWKLCLRQFFRPDAGIAGASFAAVEVVVSRSTGELEWPFDVSLFWENILNRFVCVHLNWIILRKTTYEVKP